MAVSLSDVDDSAPSNGPICPVCFRDYSDSEANLVPRILQCGHTYCTECLDRLLNTEPDIDDFQQVVLQIRYGGREWTTVRRQPLLSRSFASNDLKCPTCSKMNFITNRDVHSLTKNFALLGCRSSNQNQPRRQNSSKHFCEEHSHEKRVYCRDCRDLVCAYCQLYGAHKSHDCAIATEAAQPSVDCLKLAMENVTTHLSDLNTGQKAVKKAEKKLKRNRHQCERQVKGYFDRLIRSLEAKRNALLMSIGTWTEEQMYILNAQLQSLASAIGDSENLQKTCDSLIKGDPLDALSQQDDVIKEVTDLQSQVKGLALQPLINPWIKCNVVDVPTDILADMLKNCTLTYDTDVQSGDEATGSDTYDSISSSDQEGDHCHRNRLSQEGAGAGASASPGKKGKKKYSQETPNWLTSGASMMPTLDSPEYPQHWSLNQRTLTNQHTSQQQQTASSQGGAFPSPPNNAFHSSAEMPAAQASDPNSMFLNPISTKAKYTNLLNPRLTLDLNSDTNSEDEDTPIPPHLSIPVHGDSSSSDSHHSDDEENGTSILNVSRLLGSPYIGPPGSLRHAGYFRRGRYIRSLSMGECSASPDEEDDGNEETVVTTGEIYAIPPGMDQVPRNTTCQSPDDPDAEEDFTYTHHLTRLHRTSPQSNEIVIPLRHPYSWSSSIPTNSRAVNSPGGNRAHTVAIDVTQVGGGDEVVVEASVGEGPEEEDDMMERD